MNTDDWTAFGAIVTAVGVVVAAVMAYWTTRKAAAAAADSADTAREVAQIERDRWHRELTPELTFSLIRVGSNRLRLTTTLAGPVGLDHLDTITLTVRDEAGRDHSAGPHYDEAMRTELPSVIWGPARFSPGVDGVAAPGRQCIIRSLERGNFVHRQMDNSEPPSWFQDPGDWVDGYLVEGPPQVEGTARHESQVTPGQVMTDRGGTPRKASSPIRYSRRRASP
ncbi:hypothetical protein ACF052_04820 [Streptomyces pilosus]|uniref:hypothetical protein n=1 Tax=Streptomyces pilosus TaxID=28893 RepID=UPI003703464F